jgi:hypothetical protein
MTGLRVDLRVLALLETLQLAMVFVTTLINPSLMLAALSRSIGGVSRDV